MDREPIEFTKTPLFHVGFPKAGSTTLQNQVFSRLSGASFFGRYLIDENVESEVNAVKRNIPYRIDKSVGKFYREFLKKDGLNFDMEQAQMLLNTMASNAGDRLAIFSHEGALNTLQDYPDAAVKAERIFKLFGKDLKIFINIREQKNFCISLYRHAPFDPYDVENGKPFSFKNWLEKEQRRRYTSFLDLLHFDQTATMYDDLFGMENVLVLPLELISTDPKLYADKLGSFMGADANEIETLLRQKAANVGKSAGYNRWRQLRRYLPVNSRLSALAPKFLHKAVIDALRKSGQKKIEFPKDLAREFDEKYAASNWRLAQRTGLDLEGLGYAVESSEPSSRSTS